MGGLSVRMVVKILSDTRGDEKGSQTVWDHSIGSCEGLVPRSNPGVRFSDLLICNPWQGQQGWAAIFYPYRKD